MNSEENEDIEIVDATIPVESNESSSEIIEDEDTSWAIASMSNEELVARRQAQRPDISWMEDAIDWDTADELPTFLPKKGDYVIIERYITCLPGKPWLDTRVYLMKEDAYPDGSLRLSDPVRQQQCMNNWKRGIIEGFSFKRPPKGRNPETVFESTGQVRRKRKVVAELAQKPAAPTTGEKRGRGRPKGSKNRDKATITAEKTARREERAAKRARRGKRK
jgi:hypothetical protein